MTLTLAQARTVVSDHLDDASGDRWTTTQVDTGLSMALSECMDEYVASGGDRFDIILDTTSTTAGIVAMSSTDVLSIKGITMLQGTRYWPIKPFRLEEKNIVDDTARTLQIRYVRKYSLSTTPSDPLVGVGAVTANTWDAFDHWVCARAALFCSIKDADGRPELQALDQKLAENVISHKRIPMAIPFPTTRNYLSKWFGWIWNQSAKQIIVVKTW